VNASIGKGMQKLFRHPPDYLFAAHLQWLFRPFFLPITI
jgi:hypothetical protein